MPFRARSFGLLALPAVALTCVACGDEPPVYPPIVVIIGNVGASASGGSGSNPTGTAGSGTNPSGGSNGNNAGSSSGGSGTGDPLFAHCSAFGNAPEPKVKTACDLDNLEDGGDLTGNVTSDKTLKSGHSYKLKGVVKVNPGKTLTIEPCVKIIGQDRDAVLVVSSSSLGEPTAGCTFSPGGAMTPGGKLIAVGEPMAPIVFTSAQPVGSRKPGDWGGVLLLGNARNDLARPNSRVGIEGLERAECHGYHTDEFNKESSGHLEYVRIEYASRQVGASSETNGLTFGSIGSGTEVHYVEVSNSGDDCFEWFGGTVSADHLIAFNCDDDSFDIDNGFSGHLQFLFTRQFSSTTEMTNEGIESSQGDGPSSVITAAQISNATLCGAGPTNKVETERGGAQFKASESVQLLNSYITGFTGGSRYGIDVTGGVQLNGVHVFDQMPLFGNSAKASFDGGMGNSLAEPDRFCNCWSNPPAPIPATPTEGLSTNGFPAASDANYVGAFKDASPGSNWMRGLWVDWTDK